MAEKKQVQEKTEMRTETREPKEREAEAVYSFDELVGAAGRFHTKRECVAAALKKAGKKEATLKEAELLVRKFLNKEVL